MQRTLKQLTLQLATKRHTVTHPMKLSAFLSAQLQMPVFQQHDKLKRGEILLEGVSRTGSSSVQPTHLTQSTVLLPGDTLIITSQQRIPIDTLTPLHLNAITKLHMQHAADLKKRIIYKDAHLIVLDKPSGLATQGGSKTNIHLDLLLQYLGDPGDDLKIVHRLDKDTSGLIMIARTKSSARRLSTLIQRRLIEKTYTAIVVELLPVSSQKCIETGIAIVGTAPHQRSTITHYDPSLAQDLGASDAEEGEGKVQQAITEFTVLETSKHASLVQLTPLTGRKHQLRVHCAQHLNAHILGDYKYGSGIPTGRKNPFRHDEQIKLHLHLTRLVIPRWFSTPGEGGVEEEVKDKMEGALVVRCSLPVHFAHTMNCFKLQVGGLQRYLRRKSGALILHPGIMFT